MSDSSSSEPINTAYDQLNIEDKNVHVGQDGQSGGEQSQDQGRQDQSKREKFSALLEKLSLNNEVKQKLKSFLLSNTGIVIIVILMFSASYGISAWKKHESKTSTKSVSSSGFVNESKIHQQPNTEQLTKQLSRKAIPVARQLAPSIREENVSKSDLQTMTTKIDTLSNQVKQVNQRLMVVSEQLSNKAKSKALNKDYRVLGWRLDQDTNQWVADIDYDGQVNAYYPGQHFGRWVVRQVTANGVEIK